MAPKTEAQTPLPIPKGDDPDIYGAILKIYREGKLYAQKASRNTGQGYNYVSEADFLALMRPQLAEHGIVCTPSYEVISSSVFTTAKGTPMRQVTLVGTFRFTHVPSQTFVETVTVGEGMDQQDKAPYKAMTGAQKYAIRQTFLIETGDDPEDDSAAQVPFHEDPKTPFDPRSKFEIDLDNEAKRLGAVYLTDLKKFFKENPAIPYTEGMDLTTLPGPSKRALITFLAAQPPF